MHLFVLQDARYALRRILAKPGFTATILATLTLGIGANVAMFSIVHGTLLRALPYPDSQRLIKVESREPYYKVSEPEFADYRRESRSFARVAAISVESANVTGGVDEPERITGARVSDGFFAILGVPPILGRTFTPDEDKPGGPGVIVLGYDLWVRRYGADTNIVEKEVVINGISLRVIGVMGPRFAYPSRDVAAWIPLRLRYDSLWSRNNHYLTLIAKLAPQVTFTAAVNELNTITRRWTRQYRATYDQNQPLLPNASPLDEALFGNTRAYLYALLAAVAAIQLIVCVNVASLFLARAEARRLEFAIRFALGASRPRLILQSLTESALYATAGGTLGLVLAWQGVRVFVALAPASIPRFDEVRIDTPVLLFGLVVSLATGLVFGIVPALRASEQVAAPTMKDAAPRGGQDRRRTRVIPVLVMCEIALAVVILSTAGLMLRSLSKLQSIDLGFHINNVLTMRVGLPPSEYQDDKSVVLYQALRERVQSLGGVRAAAAVADLPVSDGWSVWSILVDGAPMTSVARAPSAMREQVTPGYFDALEIPVVEGRVFTEADRGGAPLVVVVNETMAKKLWPRTSALGHTLKVLSPTAPWATVVGVVKDVRQGGFLAGPPPTMFFPHAQAGVTAYYTPADMTLVIAAEGDPLAMAGAVRTIVRELEPNATLSRIQSMEQVVAASTSSRRFSTRLLAGFALLALVLAAIGIYGLISQSVTQRTFEIGLRIALGAPRARVLAVVVGEGIRLTITGLAIGIVLSVSLARLMRSLLVEVTPSDPVTMASVTLTIALVALAASWVPARRAMAVDPMAALRSE